MMIKRSENVQLKIDLKEKDSNSKAIDIFKTQAYFEKKFPGFLLRIRKKDDKTGAYYNGNLAFTGKQNPRKREYVTLSFEESTYQCNVTDLEECKSQREIAAYVQKKTKALEKMKPLYRFSLPKITFQLAKTCQDASEVEKRLKRFQKHINPHGFLFNLESLVNDIQKELKDGSKESPKTLTILLQPKKEPTIYNMIKVQQYFLSDLLFTNYKKVDNTIKGVSMNIQKRSIDKHRHQKRELEILKKSICAAIDSYTGKEELEKKYQHQFLLEAPSILDIFPKGKVEYFEQEFGIKNPRPHKKKAYKSGRVDCIFYRLEENKLLDIYFVELKVNDEVVLGENGVLTHLDDMKGYLSHHHGEIKKLIEDRIQMWKGDSHFHLDTTEPHYHFYTVIGFEEEKCNKQGRSIEEERVLVRSHLEKLRTKEGVNQLIQENLIQDFDHYFKDQCVYSLKPDCDTQFFLESNNWDKKHISKKFQNVTEELYPGLNR